MLKKLTLIALLLLLQNITEASEICAQLLLSPDSVQSVSQTAQPITYKVLSLNEKINEFSMSYANDIKDKIDNKKFSLFKTIVVRTTSTTDFSNPFFPAIKSESSESLNLFFEIPLSDKNDSENKISLLYATSDRSPGADIGQPIVLKLNDNQPLVTHSTFYSSFERRTTYEGTVIVNGKVIKRVVVTVLEKKNEQHTNDTELKWEPIEAKITIYELGHINHY
ncbi:MAG: hypothetical protein ABL927_05505 [Bdellovibrionales bacterium]